MTSIEQRRDGLAIVFRVHGALTAAIGDGELRRAVRTAVINTATVEVFGTGSAVARQAGRDHEWCRYKGVVTMRRSRCAVGG